MLALLHFFALDVGLNCALLLAAFSRRKLSFRAWHALLLHPVNITRISHPAWPQAVATMGRLVQCTSWLCALVNATVVVR
jgi:hypothetical protein